MNTGRSVSAFSLLELLVVVAIITLLAALVIPAANTASRGFHLTQATDELTGAMNLARHAAISNNCAVEVRFYQFGDSEIPGQQPNNPLTGQYRSFQLFQFTPGGNVSPLDKMQRFPTGVIIDSGTLSSMLAASQAESYSTLNPQVSLPTASGTNYNTASFQFRPDGSTNLAIGSKWFLTLHDNVFGDKRASLPPDFATIQIDPIGGSLTTFRR